MIVPTARGMRCAAIQATSGEATAAMIDAVITGSGDRLRQAEQREESGSEQGDADEQPRHDADIPEPVGRAEDAGELRRIDLDPLLGPARWAAVATVMPDYPPADHELDLGWGRLSLIVPRRRFERPRTV